MQENLNLQGDEKVIFQAGPTFNRFIYYFCAHLCTYAISLVVLLTVIGVSMWYGLDANMSAVMSHAEVQHFMAQPASILRFYVYGLIVLIFVGALVTACLKVNYYRCVLTSERLLYIGGYYNMQRCVVFRSSIKGIRKQFNPFAACLGLENLFLVTVNTKRQMANKTDNKQLLSGLIRADAQKLLALLQNH